MSGQEITSIKVTNYKGVRGSIELEPEGKRLLVIAGPNGSGKSSFIGAVTEIFDPSGTRLTPRPINDEAPEASVTVTTDQARLVRTWKRDKEGKEDAGTLAAFALDGAKYPSGKQFVLDATGGAIFDASEFVNMDAKQQRDQLLARVELPFNLAEIDERRKSLFEGRTDVTRQVKEKAAQLAAFPPADASLPTNEVSASAILAEAEAAREHNASVRAAHDGLAIIDSQLESAEAAVARMKHELAEAEAKLADTKTRRDDLYEAFRAGPELIDTTAITEKLTTLEDTNAKVRAQAQRTAIAAEHAALTGKEETLTAQIDAIDRQKADGLAAAKFPVEGMSVDDDGITFDGIPFKQVNTAQKVVIAFDLMTQAQPDLRLVIIKDGDTLDATSLAGIQKIAEARDYYVLVERDRDESRSIASAVFSNGQLAPAVRAAA